MINHVFDVQKIIRLDAVDEVKLLRDWLYIVFGE